MSVNILEEELLKGNLFHDESKLLSSYIPERLPFREDQLRELAQYFRGLLTNSDNFYQNVVILGTVGSGKTVLAKRFGYSLQTIACKRGIVLKYIHLNARKLHSPYLVLLETIKRINPHFPTRGFSTQELAQYLLNSLEKQKIHLLLCIDEVDYISQKKGTTNLLYWLTRSGDEQISGNSRISLITIARDQKFYQNLEDSIRTSLLRNNIILDAYSIEKIREILKERVYAAFKEDVVNTEVIDFIAEIAAIKGDARYAIEILRNAGKIANMRHSPEILIEHVQQAKRSIITIDINKLLQSLSLHQKIVLQALVVSIKETPKLFISLNKLISIYQKICKKISQKPRKRTQIWHYVQELTKMGLITSRMENKNIHGRRSVLGPANVPIELLETELKHALQFSV
ncbi:MAG: Cdc6/Cdc18 family protein [Promethearchaeota archaeon]